MLALSNANEFLGAGVAACAVLGLIATLLTSWTVLASEDSADREPTSRRFFFLFSSLSLLCNSLLLAIAAFVYIGRPISWSQFLGFLLLPWIYVGWLGRLWLHPRFGTALAPVTGIGNVGMAVPSLTLLPIWGAIALSLLA
jgi:hypothetical protein